MENNSIKMNTTLAKAEHSASVYKNQVGGVNAIFKQKQGMFRGELKTYQPREGFSEDPSKVGMTRVQSTVDEQLEYFRGVAEKYLREQFQIERTNSMGAKRVKLECDGICFGEFTAIELMRLKSVLTDGALNEMYANIPVRSDSEIWTKSEQFDYSGRGIFETRQESGVSRTTESEDVILKDPNVDPEHLPSNYRATVTTKKRTIEIGDYTRQNFSGEWTQTQKAELLGRKSRLLNAVIGALKEVNECESAEPALNVKAFLGYIDGSLK